MIYKIILLISAFAASWLKKIDSLPYFIHFILFTNLLESLIGYILAIIYNNNIWLYYLFIIICVLYYLYVLKYALQNKIYKKNLKIGSFIFLILSLVNILEFQGISKLNTITYNIGMLFVLYNIILLFKEKYIRSEFDFYRQPIFFFCLGIALFYCAVFPILILNNYLMSFDLIFTKNLYILIELGNVLLSLGYLLAIIAEWRRRY